MKTYTVTFREWMYQEKEIIVDAATKKEAVELAQHEMEALDDPRNRRAEWYGSEFKELKSKVRIKK